MALVQMSLLLIFGILVMKLNWGQEPLALFVLLFSAALAAAAFGTTLGTFIKTEGQANGLSIMFGMLFALMGGCWYPLELFPHCHPKCGENPADHLGHAGDAGFGSARRRINGYPAGSGRAAGICGDLFCCGSGKVQI